MVFIGILQKFLVLFCVSVDWNMIDRLFEFVVCRNIIHVLITQIHLQWPLSNFG
jgi:hypothetical protein